MWLLLSSNAKLELIPTPMVHLHVSRTVIMPETQFYLPWLHKTADNASQDHLPFDYVYGLRYILIPIVGLAIVGSLVCSLVRVVFPQQPSLLTQLTCRDVSTDSMFKRYFL